jgi:hypothetical protein
VSPEFDDDDDVGEMLMGNDDDPANQVSIY